MGEDRVVRLSVHKNTQAQRLNRELRRDMREAARDIARADGLVGFLFCGLTAEGGAVTAFSFQPGAIPLGLVSEWARRAAERAVEPYLETDS